MSDTIDTTPLQEVNKTATAVVAAMHPELLKRALVNSLRREGNKLKKQAITEFENRAPRLRGRLNKPVNVLVHKYGIGFRLRVKKNGQGACIVNRKEKEKPAPFWMEYGTEQRSNRYRRTGKLKALHVIGNLSYNEAAISDALFVDMEEYANRILKQYS